VTEPENREPKPEAPKPEPPTQAWISPRLREKLGDAKGGGGGGDDYDFLEKGAPIGLIITVVIVALAAVGIWYTVHLGQVKAKAELARAAKAAAEARAEAVRDSLVAAAHADSLKAQARADSIAFAKLPKWKQRQILAEKAKKAAAASAAAAPKPAAPAAGAGSAAGAAPAAGTAAADTSAKAPPAPVEKGPFVIDAASFLDEARANEEAEALKTKTSLPAQVVGVAVGGATSYHVYLGKYTTRGRAEAAAGHLFDKGAITQATVVAQPAAASAAPAVPATPAAPDTSH
jgi:hypothetical protein